MERGTRNRGGRVRQWTGTFLVFGGVIAVVLVGLFAGCGVSAGVGGDWTVERQTQAQKNSYELLKQRAKVAAEEATPAVLAYLDSQEFRDSISNLPEDIQSMTSEQLLVLLNDTLLLSAVTHGIYAANIGTFDASVVDVTLEEVIALNLTFIPNIWERIAIGELNATQGIQPVATFIENAAEVLVLLLPNFTTPFPSVSLAQAQERISYTAVNIYQGSAGGQYFGNVQMVIKPDYLRDLLVISPYDTGNYASCCLINSTFVKENYCTHPSNQTFNSSSCPEVTLGTMDYLTHLYLQNQNYWNIPTITNIFQRFFAQPQPELFLYQEGIYFEGDVLGNLLLPDAVQYVIGDFSTLFGKTVGDMVIQWCASQGLPLVWTMGIPNVDIPVFMHNITLSAPLNQSFFDPTVLMMNVTSINNVTVPPSALSTFQQVWDLTNSTLLENPSAQNSSSYWFDTWAALWNKLPELHFNQLRVGNCADLDACFGVNDLGFCYCRFLSSSGNEDDL